MLVREKNVGIEFKLTLPLYLFMDTTQVRRLGKRKMKLHFCETTLSPMHIYPQLLKLLQQSAKYQEARLRLALSSAILCCQYRHNTLGPAPHCLMHVGWDCVTLMCNPESPGHSCVCLSLTFGDAAHQADMSSASVGVDISAEGLFSEFFLNLQK
jgi:hypothetical protein